METAIIVVVTHKQTKISTELLQGHSVSNHPKKNEI